MVEAKLEKATATYEANFKKVADATVSTWPNHSTPLNSNHSYLVVHLSWSEQSKKIHELNAYLQLERSDRAKLEQQLQEHRETIHQLTHHVRVLRTQLEVQQEQAQLGLSGVGMGTGIGDSPPRGLHTADYAFPAGLSTIHAHTGVAAGTLPDGALLDTHYAHHGHSHSQALQHSQFHPSHPHLHTAQSARHNMTAAAQHHDPSMAHLSRTVPLTPASVSKTHPASGSGMASGHGHGHGERLNFTSPGAFHGSGTDVSLRDSRAVPGYTALQAGHSHLSDVNIIRSSIPPPPWQQE